MGQGVLGVPAAILSRIARAAGTPTYVYDADAIRDRYSALTGALAGVPHRIHYSVKANSNLAVLKLLHGLGAGADIVSGGELRRTAEAGIPPGDVVFSGVGKNPLELRAAVLAGVGLINIEDESEVDAIESVLDDASVAVGVRVNPDVTTETHPYTQTGARGMKFGVPLDRVPALAGRLVAHPRLRLVSIGMHVGSQIADARCYAEGADKLTGIISFLRDDGVDTIRSVDLGGGLGVSYTGEPAIDLGLYAEVVRRLHERTGLAVLLEPGRFLVGEAGGLLARVLYRKHSGGRDFVIVDAGMNDFVRPALYQARHRLSVVEPGSHPLPAVRVDVVGPICESGDFLALDQDLAPVGVGGLVCIEGAGAYGFSMSSTYNSRPRAAEVLVDGPRFGIVREREPMELLWIGETAEPQWID